VCGTDIALRLGEYFIYDRAKTEKKYEKRKNKFLPTSPGLLNIAPVVKSKHSKNEAIHSRVLSARGSKRTILTTLQHGRNRLEYYTRDNNVIGKDVYLSS